MLKRSGRTEEDVDQEVLTAGVEVKPIPQVVFKLDYQWLKTEARTGVNRFNVAMGYLF